MCSLSARLPRACPSSTFDYNTSTVNLDCDASTPISNLVLQPEISHPQLEVTSVFPLNILHRTYHLATRARSHFPTPYYQRYLNRASKAVHIKSPLDSVSLFIQLLQIFLAPSGYIHHKNNRSTPHHVSLVRVHLAHRAMPLIGRLDYAGEQYKQTML